MPHFHIEGLKPYDGDWEVDLTAFTNRELHLIKRISGVRAGELEEAFDKQDNDLIVAFVIIALQRAGLKVDEDRIWDAPADSTVAFVADEEDKGDEASPPDQKPPASSGSGDENKSSSGEPSSNGGDPQESGLSRIGSPPSETTVPSDPVISGT